MGVRGLDPEQSLSEMPGSVLAAVVAHIPAGLVIVDPAGKIVLANEEALRILRIESVESGKADNWRSWEGYRQDGRRYAAEEWPMARTIREGEYVEGERIELAVGDGARIVVEVSSAPVRDRAGRMAGGVALLQDVTARERQERAERDFVTNAAHGLQSPLAVILSAIEVLQAGAKDTPERDVFLDHIKGASERLARLAQALLVLARAQIGLEAPKAELVALEPLLAEVARGLRVADGVEVAVSCEPEIAVVTNRELVEQAVVNLAENAAKHTSQGRIELRATLFGGRVQITVADTGDGIPAEDFGRIFERFYRVGDHGANGSGLGLAIVRAAADALGGQVELDSKLGEGTVVRLTLPKAGSLIS